MSETEVKKESKENLKKKGKSFINYKIEVQVHWTIDNRRYKDKVEVINQNAELN